MRMDAIRHTPPSLHTPAYLDRTNCSDLADTRLHQQRVVEAVVRRHVQQAPGCAHQ
jgi:hypothetical protein